MTGTLIEPRTATVQGLPTWTFDHAAGLALDDTLQLIRTLAGDINGVVTSAGALRICGLNSLRTAQDFDQAIHAVTPKLRDYVGGTSPRERAHGKVMTATYTPDNWSIILHQEMAYTVNLPARISFFCERPAAVSGGDTTFADMRQVLKAIRPDVRQRLQQHGLQLCRTVPSLATQHLKPGVKKPWTEVFETDDKAVVADIVAAKGWTHEWLEHDLLRLWQDVIPATRIHPETGDEVWCNQAHFYSPECQIRWADEDGRVADRDALQHALDHHPEFLDRIYLGNGQPVAADDALHIYAVLQGATRSVALAASDLLLVDNLLVAHGRTAVRGDRSILVAMADR
jgi:hypothetical protein